MGVKHHANPSGHKSIWHGQGSGGVISCWATSSRRLPWGKAKASPPTLGGEGASQPSRTSSLPMVRGRYHCKMWSYSFLPCRVDHFVGVLVGVGSKVNNLCLPSLWPLPLPPANATSVAPLQSMFLKLLGAMRLWSGATSSARLWHRFSYTFLSVKSIIFIR